MLAENTTEAVKIVRVGDWVYKYLKPHDTFPLQTVASRLRQIYLRVRESWLHQQLNPLRFDEALRCLISRFVPGRYATPDEANAIEEQFRRTRRGYLTDIGARNAIVGETLVVIDFAVSEHHPDWRFRQTKGEL